VGLFFKRANHFLAYLQNTQTFITFNFKFKNTMKTFITLICFFTLSINVFSQSKNDQLFQAVRENDKVKVENLLKLGCDVNYFIETTSPWIKVNLLMTAVNNKNLEIAKLLLENKADISWKDGSNNLAIYYAARSGNVEMVKLLLENGASVFDKDGQGHPVLNAAKESKNNEVISFVEAKTKESHK
jgi:ankyrin repeat protein